MEFIHKIRALQIGKRKTFRRVLLAEILLILLGIVGLFGRNEVYEYPSEGIALIKSKTGDRDFPNKF